MQHNRVHEIVEVVEIGRIQNLGIQDIYAHRFEAGARSVQVVDQYRLLISTGR